MDLHVSIVSPDRMPTDDGPHPPASPEEMELLQKLEAANKRLEQDEKSLKSVSGNSSNTDLVRRHSRKGSSSSLVSTNSVGSHISNLNFDEDPGNNPDESWVVWGKIIADWDYVSKKRSQYIRDLVRKGIPHHFRGIVWQYLCEAHDSEYKDHFAVYLKMVSPCEKVIRRDIARTYPEHDFFREKDGLGQESLFNVMKAYSLHDREVGYCQGSGFIVGLLLMQMPEEEAFAVLVKLMQDYRLRELFKPTMAELGLCFYQLEYMIQENMPNLYLHFQSQSFHTSMYASQWFLTLYTTVLPLPVACRIMDMFISEGTEVIFKVGIALLQEILPDLLCLDMEQMLQYFQKNVPVRFESDEATDKLIEGACEIKYNFRKMKKLEKEYTVLKSKEHIEQVELRRLRSENKLVKHRIDNLEKENVMLADRLIQGQVTRAHEAEDMFVVKRELSTLRTQHSEALEKLEEANDMISNMKLRADSTASNESNSEELIRSLRHELNDTRMRAMSQTCTVQEMKGKVRDLEEENSKLRRDPDCEVQTIQEELIAVKLREAEANLSMKELRQRVNEMEQHWQKYQERSQNKEGKASKSQLQSLHDELMTVKLREAETLADLKEMKQKVMEFETQNHICSHQIKRLDEENRSLKEKLDESLEREKILKSEIQQWERRADDGENRRKEEEVMQKICAAEHSQAVAEMRRKVAELEIKNQELLTSVELKTQSHTQDLENQIADLEDEVVQLRLSSSKKKMTFSTLDINKVGYESDSEAESEDMDTTITDSGKFRNNLSSQYFPIYEDNGEVVDEEGMPIENVNESNPQQGDGAMEASHDNDKSQVLRNVGHSLSESGDRTVHSSGGRLDSQNNVQVQKDNENTSKLNGNTYDAFSDEMERALDNLG